MKKSNFEFLRTVQPRLFEYGSAAEQYVHLDPQSAIFKLRCFAEHFVVYVYKELSITAYGATDFCKKLENRAFVDAVEGCVLEKLHFIRRKGNKAIHAGKASAKDALALVKEAYFLGAWIYLSYHDGSINVLPTYEAPVESKLGKSPSVEGGVVGSDSEVLQQTQRELIELQKQFDEAQKLIGELGTELNQAKLSALKEGSERALGSFDFGVQNTRDSILIDDIFAEYDLTDGQAELVRRLDSFLCSAKENVFLLKGYAGTGKTFITKGLTEYFRAIRRNYVLAAPTGKAAKVIAKKAESSAYTIHKTIYSFKDIAEYRDEDLEGTETYKYYAQVAVNERSVDTVYVIDEASMVSDAYSEAEFIRFGSGHLLRDFLKFVNLDHNDHRKKVIFIGDDAQLPPVGMKFSPALSSKYLYSEYGLPSTGYELEEVVRQKSGSGIMRNAEMIRNSLADNIYNQLDIKLEYPDVRHLEYDELLQQYLKSCDGKINAESIVIAHSNADVASYNRRIREHFFPGSPDVAAGDKVMAVSNSSVYGLFISNGDFGIVRKAVGEAETRSVTLKRKSKETGELEEIKISLSFRHVELGFRDLDGSVHWFEAKIVENLLYSDEPNLSSDEHKALYLDFCIRHPNLKRKGLEFKEKLQSDPYFNALRVKFGYAITCHKAQGSEWNNVFVKCKTHQSQLSADYFRWLYTAITRASKQLYLLDEPHIGLLGSTKNSGSPGDLPWDVSTKKSSGIGLAESNTNVTDLIDGAREETSSINGRHCTGSEFLDAILQNIQSRLFGADAEIVDILHQQFQESYIFSRSQDSARINIFYDGKKKITSVVLATSSALGSELLERLSPLKGTIPHLSASGNNSGGYSSDEKFLNELHQRVLKILEQSEFNVVNVAEQQWSQRYTFSDSSGVAVIDIYYNKKKQFNSCSLVKNLCTSRELSARVMQLITSGVV